MNPSSAPSAFQALVSVVVVVAVVLLLCLVSAIFILGYALFKRHKTVGRAFGVDLEKEYPVTEQDRASALGGLPESLIPRAKLKRDTRNVYILLLVLVAATLLMLGPKR